MAETVLLFFLRDVKSWVLLRQSCTTCMHLRSTVRTLKESRVVFSTVRSYYKIYRIVIGH